MSSEQRTQERLAWEWATRACGCTLTWEEWLAQPTIAREEWERAARGEPTDEN